MQAHVALGALFVSITYRPHLGQIQFRAALPQHFGFNKRDARVRPAGARLVLVFYRHVWCNFNICKNVAANGVGSALGLQPADAGKSCNNNEQDNQKVSVHYFYFINEYL